MIFILNVRSKILCSMVGGQDLETKLKIKILFDVLCQITLNNISWQFLHKKLKLTWKCCYYDQYLQFLGKQSIEHALTYVTVLPRIFGLVEYLNNWARIIVFVFAEFSNSKYYSNIWIIDPNTTNNLLVICSNYS